MVLHTSGVREGHPDYDQSVEVRDGEAAGWDQGEILWSMLGKINAWQSGETVHSQAFSRASSESNFFLK